MRPQLNLFVTLCLVVSIVSSCKKRQAESTAILGSGVVKEEERSIEPFHAVRATGVMHVHYTPGTPRLSVRGDDNLLPKLLGRVEAGELRLTQDGFLKPAMVLAVEVTGPGVDLVVADGASRVKLEGIRAARLELRAAGASVVEVSGSADELVVNGELAARLDLSALSARKAHVKATKGARITLGYLEELDADVSEVARVEYSGDPRVTPHVAQRGVIAKRQ